MQARYLGDLVDVCPTVQARQYGETQCRQVGAGNMERYNQFIEACRSSLGVVLGDLVDVAAWGIVPCVSKIDTLDFSTVYYKCFLRTSARTHMSAHAHAR